MKNKSLLKSVVSLAVTLSVALSLGTAALAISGVPCSSIGEGDFINEGTVIFDDLGYSYIYIYDSIEDYTNDKWRERIDTYDIWTADADYLVIEVDEHLNYYHDLYLVPASSEPSGSSESSLTPEQRRLLSVQSFVETLYDRILGRTYDVTGRDYWVDQLMNHGATGSDVVRGFIASSEFATARGSTSSLVLELYSDLFNRVPSSAELANWTSALENGASKDDILNSFLSSPEWADVCAFYGVNV